MGSSHWAFVLHHHCTPHHKYTRVRSFLSDRFKPAGRNPFGCDLRRERTSSALFVRKGKKKVSNISW